MTQQEHLETGSSALRTEERPQGETEIAVGRVFAEMFGISDLPRAVSFFDLGFDSLAVAAACAGLEQATGVRVSFSQLFRTPTVARLAAWIDDAGDKLPKEPGIPAKPQVFESAGLVAITPMQAETVPTDIVVEVAWWFDGELDDTALECAATDIHRRQQSLHARYLVGPDLGLAELPADPGKAQFHRLGYEDSDAAAFDALWRTLRQPLRLGDGEVWRCAIVRSGQSGRALFGLAVHHAAFDGHSLDLMTAELHLAYAARAAGTVPQWPGRVASLAEMAADFRHQLATADVDEQRQHWRHELSELPACRLPGRNDASDQVAATSPKAIWPGAGPATSCGFTVANAQLRVWEDYARAKGMSASVAMAAVFVQAIVRAGGSRDFGLMVAIANRAGEVIDRTFTNRVGNVLLRPNAPFRSGPHILARMQDSYHQAMAARDILVDPKELNSVLSGEGSDGAISLDRLANLTYQTYSSTLALDLGGVVGTIPPELDVATKSHFGVMLQVVPGPEGLAMDMITRTDMYEAGLADSLRQHFVDLVSDGPERLELESAR